MVPHPHSTEREYQILRRYRRATLNHLSPLMFATNRSVSGHEKTLNNQWDECGNIMPPKMQSGLYEY